MSTTLGEQRRESEDREAPLSPVAQARRVGRALLVRRRGDVLAVAGLVAVLAFLWGRGAGKWYWLDEGIAAGIASHPLGDIPELLRQDGSPPLYYLVLHLWMSVVGTSEVHTHLLSLVFAVATVPAALWAGWSLFGRRAGWMCALAAALNPFLAFYSNETRMYTLVVLLGVLAVATYLHGFVFRRRRYLPAFAVLLALLLYTHNWGLLLAVGAGAALVPCLLLSADRRRLMLDAALAFGAVAVLYAPWLPTLLYQRSQELQPWARRPTLVAIRDDIAMVFGGLEGVLAIGLGAGFGLAVVLQRRWSRPAVAAVAMGVMPLVVVFGGWLSSVWAHRYLAVVLAPLLILLGLGLANGGRASVAALGMVAFLAAPIGTKTPPYQKSNARAVVEAVSASLRPGDVIVSPDVQLVPLLANYLPDRLRYVTTAGPVPDEDIVDWRDSMQRLEQGDPGRTLPPVLDALPVGARVLLACPPSDPTRNLSVAQPGSTDETVAAAPETPGLGESDSASSPEAGGTESEDSRRGDTSDDDTVPVEGGKSPFHSLIKVRCEQAAEVIMGDDTLRLEDALFAPGGVVQTPVDGYLFTKVA
ncbi:MAG TPA: glycosyltransferase family 39 protein [Acidimicrobiales bacterium]|nr:glycosyltransferase family 39 protein [Acidimicrobiales bacterium]